MSHLCWVGRNRWFLHMCGGIPFSGCACIYPSAASGTLKDYSSHSGCFVVNWGIAPIYPAPSLLPFLFICLVLICNKILYYNPSWSQTCSPFASVFLVGELQTCAIIPSLAFPLIHIGMDVVMCLYGCCFLITNAVEHCTICPLVIQIPHLRRSLPHLNLSVSLTLVVM